jgi:ribonuclease BN (tRNA processing enzyme)
MRVTFLGSGGAFCDFRVNYQNNAVVETAEGLVLVDCGVTAMQSLRELGLSPWDVTAVLVTHLHADHASPQGLVGVRYYAGPDGHAARMSTRIVAPPDVLGPLMKSLDPYLDEYSDRDDVLRHGGAGVLVDAEAAHELEVGGIRFRYFRVPHVTGGPVDKPAYGLVFEEGPTRVVWSGDTTLDRRWVERTAGDAAVDGFFHECTFSTRPRTPVHTHWSELSELPREVLGRLVLMHHTAVPEGVDAGAVRGAARRHERFVFGPPVP